jgi:hypothetical protein
MCRNIRTLFNYDPPANEEEIQLAAIQYVRKVSGFHKPSKSNEAVFLEAVCAVETATATLLQNLQTQSLPRNREIEITRAKTRGNSRNLILKN